MPITTNVINYSKPHASESGGGGVIYANVKSNASLPKTINVQTVNAANGNIDNLNGKSASFTEGSFLYLITENGTVTKINGNELSYNKGNISSLTGDTIKLSGKITAADADITNAWITNLNSKYITTEYLNVTKQAHFFELIIDKIKSVGGQIMLTPANCIIDYVKAVDASNHYVPVDDANVKAYYVFWRATDGEGRTSTNDWWEYDQAICQSFGNVSTGVQYDVSNKYYWRLVEDILPDRYMNINTGEELPISQTTAATKNTVYISTPKVAFEYNSSTIEISTGWHTVAQTINGSASMTGVEWDEDTGGTGAATTGTMTTKNTVFGIQMNPIDGTELSKAIIETFTFNCTPARLNVGIYFKDNTSVYFAAPEDLPVADPETGLAEYTFTIDSANSTIESIVITNADEVEWYVVHGIRLSDTDKDTNAAPVGNQGPQGNLPYNYSSIPSKGDNLAQLGYRYDHFNEGEPEYDEKRASAIIISAYNTPDQGTQGIPALTPPSYAQYTHITDYNLATHRRSFIDANGAAFIGNVYNGQGQSLEEMIGIKYEYIYKQFANEQTYWDPNSDDNPSHWDAVQQEIYLGPQGHQWNMTPSGVQSDMPYEYAAVRTKAPGIQGATWTKYGTPYVNSVWGGGATGPQGPQGSQGAQGEPGASETLYELYDWGSITYYAITLDPQTNDLVYALVIHPKFKVIRTVEGQSSFISYNEANYELSAYAEIDKEDDSSQPANPLYYKCTLRPESAGVGSSDAIFEYKFEADDHYFTDEELETLISRNALINIALLPYNNNIEIAPDSSDLGGALATTQLFTISNSGAALNIVQGQNASIKALVTGTQSLANGVQGVQAQMTLIGIQAAGIQSDVQTLTTTVNGQQQAISTLQQQAEGFQTTVTKVDNMQIGGTNIVKGTRLLDSSTAIEYAYCPYGTVDESYGFNGMYGAYYYNLSNSNYDLLKTDDIEVTPDTEYVLSFWAKGDGQCRSFMYVSGYSPTASDINDEGTTEGRGDGYSIHTLTPDWKRHWVKYKTSSSLPSNHKVNFIFCRLTNGDAAYVCGPKIEIGNMPTDWSEAPEDASDYTDGQVIGVQSQITQKADEILMQVGNCGIDITNERISLNGDTEVHGTLTLDDEGQGFILEGAQGKTQISPQSIGTYDDFSQVASSTQSGGKSIVTLVNGSGDATMAFEQNFGNVNSGQTISIANIIVQTKDVQGNTIQSYSHSTSFAAYVDGYLQSNNNTFTTNRSGTLTIRCDVDVTMPSTYYNQYIILGATYEVTIPTSDTYTLIGYDGIASKYNDGITYFGSGCSVMKYGVQGLRIDDTGIKKTWNNGATWRRINSLVCTTTAINYQIQPTDEMITCTNSSQIYLTFPSAATNTGRIIYVKSTGSGNISCQGSGPYFYFMQPNSTATSSSYNMDDHLTIFISDGSRWIVGQM